jgi:8-oxo-dGTP diphosphatase
MTKVTTDIIIEFPNGEIVLAKRGNPPYKGKWGLPGGMVEEDETVEQAAVREAKEETGLDIQLVRMVGVFSKPGRDPRGQYVSVVFHAVPVGGKLKANSDAAEVKKTKDYSKLKLAFDHNEILALFKATKIS